MRNYFQTARYDGSARALTEDEMHKTAPSIFAVEAHSSRSDRFRPIPTIEVLRSLQKEGFSPVGARQSTARSDDRRDYTKHMIRLRRLDEATKYTVGDTVQEILLKNANDGTSAYDLMCGLFRINCLNSMVTQVGDVDSVKVRHSGDVNAKVIEGTYRVLDSAALALRAPDEWSRVQLDRDERQIFAEAAHIIRFADSDGEVTTAIKPEQMLHARRSSDQGSDLWRTFNVAQENAIRGGLTAWGRDANNRPRRSTTRGVNGIDQDVKLNRALWLLSNRMAELKGIAPIMTTAQPERAGVQLSEGLRALVA